jgi:hypothetical protein
MIDRCLRASRCVAGAALSAIVVLTVACGDRRDPITLDEGVITIENQTGSEWKDVRVVVNDYFGGSAPSLAPGQRMNAVLSNMQTGFGQRFDRNRMSVYKIEVTAKDADGEPVKLTWGEDRSGRQ